MKVTIHFGTRSITDREEFEKRTQTRDFATQAEVDAYITGVYDSSGWMNYVVHEGYVISRTDEELLVGFEDNHMYCSPEDCEVCIEWRGEKKRAG
jgi:hypothetical protein